MLQPLQPVPCNAIALGAILNNLQTSPSDASSSSSVAPQPPPPPALPKLRPSSRRHQQSGAAPGMCTAPSDLMSSSDGPLLQPLLLNMEAAMRLARELGRHWGGRVASDWEARLCSKQCQLLLWHCRAHGERSDSSLRVSLAAAGAWVDGPGSCRAARPRRPPSGTPPAGRSWPRRGRRTRRRPASTAAQPTTSAVHLLHPAPTPHLDLCRRSALASARSLRRITATAASPGRAPTFAGAAAAADPQGLTSAEPERPHPLFWRRCARP